MRVLGVTCSSTEILCAVTEDGVVLDDTVERIEVASLYEASEELEATLAEIGRALATVKPDLVTILLPESTYKATHREIAPRVALETLVRLAAVRAAVPVETLSRPTVRSRLSLSTKGKLAAHVSERIPSPAGKHWSAGRNVAALAALAGEAGS
jgi:hypothetical protein